MNLYQQLFYLLLFRGYIILRCVRFFVIFSLNYQQGVTVLYLYQQMRRDYKITFTDKSKTNLWIYVDLTKVNPWNRLTSLYIISYLHFLKLNNILTLPQTFLFITEAGFGLIQTMFTLFFACQI